MVSFGKKLSHSYWTKNNKVEIQKFVGPASNRMKTAQNRFEINVFYFTLFINKNTRSMLKDTNRIQKDIWATPLINDGFFRNQ